VAHQQDSFGDVIDRGFDDHSGITRAQELQQDESVRHQTNGNGYKSYHSRSSERKLNGIGAIDKHLTDIEESVGLHTENELQTKWAQLHNAWEESFVPTIGDAWDVSKGMLASFAGAFSPEIVEFATFIWEALFSDDYEVQTVTEYDEDGKKIGTRDLDLDEMVMIGALDSTVDLRDRLGGQEVEDPNTGQIYRNGDKYDFVENLKQYAPQIAEQIDDKFGDKIPLEIKQELARRLGAQIGNELSRNADKMDSLTGELVGVSLRDENGGRTEPYKISLADSNADDLGHLVNSVLKGGGEKPLYKVKLPSEMGRGTDGPDIDNSAEMQGNSPGPEKPSPETPSPATPTSSNMSPEKNAEYVANVKNREQEISGAEYMSNGLASAVANKHVDEAGYDVTKESEVANEKQKAEPDSVEEAIKQPAANKPTTTEVIDRMKESLSEAKSNNVENAKSNDLSEDQVPQDQGHEVAVNKSLDWKREEDKIAMLFDTAGITPEEFMSIFDDAKSVDIDGAQITVTSEDDDGNIKESSLSEFLKDQYEKDPQVLIESMKEMWGTVIEKDLMAKEDVIEAIENSESRSPESLAKLSEVLDSPPTEGRSEIDEKNIEHKDMVNSLEDTQSQDKGDVSESIGNKIDSENKVVDSQSQDSQSQDTSKNLSDESADRKLNESQEIVPESQEVDSNESSLTGNEISQAEELQKGLSEEDKNISNQDSEKIASLQSESQEQSPSESLDKPEKDEIVDDRSIDDHPSVEKGEVVDVVEEENRISLDSEKSYANVENSDPTLSTSSDSSSSSDSEATSSSSDTSGETTEDEGKTLENLENRHDGIVVPVVEENSQVTIDEEGVAELNTEESSKDSKSEEKSGDSSDKGDSVYTSNIDESDISVEIAERHARNRIDPSSETLSNHDSDDKAEIAGNEVADQKSEDALEIKNASDVKDGGEISTENKAIDSDEIERVAESKGENLEKDAAPSAEVESDVETPQKLDNKLESQDLANNDVADDLESSVDATSEEVAKDSEPNKVDADKAVVEDLVETDSADKELVDSEPDIKEVSDTRISEEVSSAERVEDETGLERTGDNQVNLIEELPSQDQESSELSSENKLSDSQNDLPLEGERASGPNSDMGDTSIENDVVDTRQESDNKEVLASDDELAKDDISGADVILDKPSISTEGELSEIESEIKASDGDLPVGTGESESPTSNIDTGDKLLGAEDNISGLGSIDSDSVELNKSELADNDIADSNLKAEILESEQESTMNVAIGTSPEAGNEIEVGGQVEAGKEESAVNEIETGNEVGTGNEVEVISDNRDEKGTIGATVVGDVTQEDIEEISSEEGQSHANDDIDPKSISSESQEELGDSEVIAEEMARSNVTQKVIERQNENDIINGADKSEENISLIVDPMAPKDRFEAIEDAIQSEEGALGADNLNNGTLDKVETIANTILREGDPDPKYIVDSEKVINNSGASREEIDEYIENNNSESKSSMEEILKKSHPDLASQLAELRNIIDNSLNDSSPDPSANQRGNGHGGGRGK